MDDIKMHTILKCTHDMHKSYVHNLNHAIGKLEDYYWGTIRLSTNYIQVRLFIFKINDPTSPYFR